MDINIGASTSVNVANQHNVFERITTAPRGGDSIIRDAIVSIGSSPVGMAQAHAAKSTLEQGERKHQESADEGKDTLSDRLLAKEKLKTCRPASISTSSRQNWMTTLLWCAAGVQTAAAMAIEGRAEGRGALAPITPMPLALTMSPILPVDTILQSTFPEISSMRYSAQASAPEYRAEEQLAYRRTKRHDKRQTYRHRVPEMKGPSQLGTLRRQYLEEYVTSPTYKAERATLIEQAKKLAPDTTLRMDDNVHDRNGVQFPCPFLVYTLSTETTSGWWPFTTTSVTKTVYIQPIGSSNDTPIELKA